MKYNKAYDGEDFEKYLDYLDTIKEKLSKNIFDFVSDPNRHNFSEQSLHDSWLKSFECVSNFETDKTDIILVLISANFDREFHFRFQSVSQFKLSQRMSDMYRDLITFEIGAEKDNDEEEKLIFRAMFALGETEIEIYSDKIEINEKIINQ